MRRPQSQRQEHCRLRGSGYIFLRRHPFLWTSMPPILQEFERLVEETQDPPVRMKLPYGTHGRISCRHY